LFQGKHKATTLQFSFYQEAKQAAGEPGEAGEMCKIHIAGLATARQSEQDLVKELIDRHRVPKDLRSASPARILPCGLPSIVDHPSFRDL
jgi:hypothetical protein